MTGWDGASAKSELFEWGVCPKDNTVLSKTKLKPYFGKITGDGKQQGDYSYPLAHVVDGKPQYDRDGLIAAFGAARGSHTGNIDNEVADKVVRIFKKLYGEDNLTEGMKQNERPIPITINEENDSPEVSWDDTQAKKALLSWATNDTGKIQKKLLMKWFLDIDGGEGQNPLNYRYPIGNIVGGNPVFDPVGINHSWSLASGAKTGTANRMIQKKIIFLKQREKIPLTNEQLEFIERHMTSGDFTKQNAALVKTYKNELRNASIYVDEKDNFYVDIDSDMKLNAVNDEIAFEIAYEYAKTGNILNDGIKLNSSIVDDVESPGEMKIIESGTSVTSDANDANVHYNSVAHYGKVIVETPEYIDIPVIPMREGVFIGTDGLPTLKLFEEFSKDAHWLEGQPILEKHTRPDEIVTYKHNRIGKLHSVQVRPDHKDVYAIARYYKNKISPDKAEQIRSGNPYDGSIAYTCETVMENGMYEKEPYQAIEKTGYHFYHFAEVPEGACSVSRGCGFNLNEAGTDSEFYVNNINDGNIMKQNKCKTEKDEEKAEAIAETVAEEPVEETLVVDEDGNECTEAELVDGKCPAAEGETEAVAEAEPVKENSVVVDVRIPEEFTTKLNAVFDENQSLKEVVADLTTRLDRLTAKMNESHEAEVKAKEQKDFDAFTARLNQAARPKANEHYEAFQKEGWSYLDKNSDILVSETVETKLMGVPAASGTSSDLLEEKRKLRETLRRRKVVV